MSLILTPRDRKQSTDPAKTVNAKKTTFSEKIFGKKESADEAIQQLDKNLTIIDNLIDHTKFITTTITDLIALIDAMKNDDSGYKELIREKASQVNTAIEKMQTSIYEASQDADNRTTSTILDYNASTNKEIKRSKTRPIETLNNKIEKSVKAKNETKTDEQLVKDVTPKADIKKLGSSKETPGGNPYKTAKKQLTNLMSYIPSMSTKTQKKRHNRKH